MKKISMRKVICVVIVLVLAVLLLPFPQFKRISTEGVLITGENRETVTVTVKATYLHYLVKSDTLKGTVTLQSQNAAGEKTEYTLMGSLFTPVKDKNFAGLYRYDGTLNKVVSGDIFFDNSWEKIYIEVKAGTETATVVVSGDGVTEEEIIGYFKQFIY